MMPAYRSMDSYPYQRNQNPFPHCYHPGIEAIPPQMKVDPSKSAFSYEQPWPYPGSYGHPFPMHLCCGYNNFPGYYSYRPSYPHAPAPSPIYYSGGYPAYGEPFFVPYSPQPHYTMELPRYEYDKCMPRDYHCCGCPNNPCHQKEGKSVKIEEQEPDVGKKVNDALVPIQLKNYPYPFVWIPPEYISNRELKNPVTAEVGEQDKNHKISDDRKPPGPGNYRADAPPAQEPRVWNGWLPFDMNGAPNIVHDGDGRRNQKWETDNNRTESEDGRMNQKHQSEHKRSEFPFPIIWMPCYNKQQEDGRTNNQESTSTPKCIEEVPHTFKDVPVNSYADEGFTNGARSSQDESTSTSGSDVTEKVTNERSIPVRQIELHQGKNELEGSDKREWNVPVNQMEENLTKKDSQTNGERQSMSPRKTSKLPPVCLRVDPLPRKKNGNGSSRSPSPPASKEHSQATAGETSKTSSCGKNDKAQPTLNLQNAPNISEKVKPEERTIQVSETKTKNGNGSSWSPSHPASKEHSQATAGETPMTICGVNDKVQPNSNLQNAPNIEPKVRTIQVSENKTSDNKGTDCRDGCQNQISLNMPSVVSMGTKESCTDGDKYKTEENKAEKGAENMMEEVTELREVRDSGKPTDEGQKEGMVLSDVDAAVLIQAAYRGYQVRKWEPLKKLKQIAEVRKEVTDVRGRIQAFEDSSVLQNDDKQRITLGETIMRLLLKLDTIQGLHPSFREIRKSLARELISLQERLDSIMAKKPQQQMQEFVVKKPAEDTPLNTQNGEYAQVQEQQEEKVAVPGEDSSPGISHGSHDTLEKHQDQFCMKGGINSLPADDGGSESQSPVDTASNEGTQPIVLPNGMVNEDVRQVVTVDACNSASGLSETDKMAVEPEAKSEVDDVPTEVDKWDMTAWKELPVGVIEDIIDVSSGMDEQNEKGRAEAQLTGCTTMMMDRSLPAMVDDSASDGVDSEIHAMMELPVGLLDEDMLTSEFEKDDETKISEGELRAEDEECIAELPMGLLDEDTAKSEFEKQDKTNEVLPTEKEECNADEKTSSSSDDAAKETQLEQQLLNEQEEVQSNGESDGWIKIDFQKEDKPKGYAPLDIEADTSGAEIGNDTKLPSLTTQGNGHEPGNGDVCLEANDANNILPEPMEFVINTKEHVPINDLQKEEEPEEKIAPQVAQVEGQDIVAEQAISADAGDTETLAKEKTELSVASSASKELPVAEHDGGLNGDAKLLEENDKLRKMMKKLLEAGNEQLIVISDLTGRVKDLERKLARTRRKRVRTKRYRPAASKMSCMKSSK